MQLITDEIRGYLSNGSWIRKMFEAGLELKKQYGEENVYDFSIGNPDLPPPPAVKQALTGIAGRADRRSRSAICRTPGYPALRKKLAGYLSKEQKIEIPESNVIMTCGAAGGINVFFRAVLSAGDEVICPAPYFVEYGFYAANAGGRLVPVKSKEFTFELDLDGIEKAITAKTRAVIINTPNNPTGQIYSRAELTRLAEILAAAEKKFGRVIYVVSDEPYRFLNFDGVELPGALEVFPPRCRDRSYSKNLSLAGERLGYIAVSPRLAVPRTCGGAHSLQPDSRLRERSGARAADPDGVYGFPGRPGHLPRAARCDGEPILSDAGIEFTMPARRLLFFPEIADGGRGSVHSGAARGARSGSAGRGFGCPGYVRFAFCVDTKVIEGARQGVKNAVAKLG